MSYKKKLVLEHYRLTEVNAIDYSRPMVSVSYHKDENAKEYLIDVAVSMGTDHVDHQFFGAIHNALHAMQGHIMYEPELECYFIDEEFKDASKDLWDRLFEHVKPENFTDLLTSLK